MCIKCVYTVRLSLAQACRRRPSATSCKALEDSDNLLPRDTSSSSIRTFESLPPSSSGPNRPSIAIWHVDKGEGGSSISCYPLRPAHTG